MKGAPAGTVGVIYCLHFDRPYRHAKHYLGWTTNLDARLAEHRAGRGARLIAVISAEGIGWTLAGAWPGTRDDERSMKRRHSSTRYCEVCQARKRKYALAA